FPLTSTPPTHLSPLSLHDALPISIVANILSTSVLGLVMNLVSSGLSVTGGLASTALTAVLGLVTSLASCHAQAAAHQVHHQAERSEEHTSELQSLAYLVCRLLLEK